MSQSSASVCSPRDGVGRYLPACYAMFFATGAGGLIYEVLWTRQLIYVFGATLLAVATVLAAFMGGLALGSILGGKRVDRSARPLRVYAVLEIGVGLAALLFPWLLKALDPLFRVMYQSLANNLAVYSAIRFVLCFVLLMIPTTMMGATLPALSRFVARSGSTLGSRLGSLYAVNTAGAVLGTFAAGFLLLAHFGVSHTNYIAVTINLVVGVLAWWLSGRIGPQPIGAEETDEAEAVESAPVVPAAPSAPGVSPSPSPALLRFVLFSYFMSGLVALAYQVVWTRSLVFSFEVMKNTTYAFSGMLTVFLLGLALGSAVMTWRVDRERDPLRLYAFIQVLIGLSGALSYFIIHFIAPTLQPFEETAPEGGIRWVGAVLNVMIKTAVSIGLPTFLMGMAFPVVVRVTVSLRRGVGADVGRLYAFNTVGAIVGSVLSGFVLIPLLGVTPTLTLLASVQVAVGAALLWKHPGLSARLRTGLVFGAAGAMAILVVRIAAAGMTVPLQQLSWYEKLLYYEEGALATVSIGEDEKGFRTIYVDNVGVAGTDRILLTDQKSLAHIPMLLVENPRSALTVGFGSGGASYSYTTYKEIERIDCVEICSTVLRPAPLLTASNHGLLIPDGVLKLAGGARLDFRGPRELNGREMAHTAMPGFRTFDPRYRIILDDARSYLHFTDTRYDIIATDCTDLRYKSNANLYDLGYFRLCGERINPGGMVVVWMPLGGLSDAAFRCALRTFRAVFPHVTIWYLNNEPTHYILLLGTKEPQRYNYDRIVERLKEESVRADLAELYLDNADKLLSCFVLDETGLDPILGDGPLNTEDTPFLEFESPKYGLGAVPLKKNLGRLYDAMTPVTRCVTGASAEAIGRLDRLQRAAPIVFRGHDHYREYRFLEAARSYLEAIEIGGADTATQTLLDFPELKATARTLLRIEEATGRPRDAITGTWLSFHFGTVMVIQQRWSDAVSTLRPAAAFGEGLDPRNIRPELSKTDLQWYHLHGRLQALLAYCYASAGQPEPARRAITRARELFADNETLRELEAAIRAGGPLPETLP